MIRSTKISRYLETEGDRGLADRQHKEVGTKIDMQAGRASNKATLKKYAPTNLLCWR